MSDEFLADAPEGIRRAELANFLRSRRAAIDPSDLGLPLSPRRRSRGLLREEVAALAGLSPTWYTQLEQGRSIHPSPAILSSLADVLRLNDDERRYMQRLAYGRTPPPPGPSSPEYNVVPGMIDLFRDSPHPLYAGNRYFDIVGWNDAAATWYTDFAALPDDHRNMLWWMFTVPDARDRFPEWEVEARDVVARTRVSLSSRADDERMLAIIEELVATSPDFRRHWNTQHVAEQRSRLRRLRHPTLGIRSYHLVALWAADDAFISYLAHLPLITDI